MVSLTAHLLAVLVVEVVLVLVLMVEVVVG